MEPAGLPLFSPLRSGAPGSLVGECEQVCDCADSCRRLVTSLSLQWKFISRALEGLSKGAVCNDVELGGGLVPAFGCSNVSLVYTCASSFHLRSGSTFMGTYNPVPVPDSTTKCDIHSKVGAGNQGLCFAVIEARVTPGSSVPGTVPLDTRCQP